MRIACLAAGLCTRLHPHTRDIHKLMMPAGDGLLIDLQLQSFATAGATRISYVVGHGGHQIQKYLESYDLDVEIDFIWNDKFDKRNLDWSAYLALSSCEGDQLYWEGDVIAAPAIVNTLMNSPAELCLAYDPQPLSSKPDTQVIMDNGRVSSLLFDEHFKGIFQFSIGSVGEFICGLKLSNAARQFVVEELENCPFEGDMQLYKIFDKAFKYFHCEAIPCDGQPWVEIDTWSDYLRAKALAGDIIKGRN